MSFKFLVVVAKLGKANRMYLSIETDPKHHGCAANFRNVLRALLKSVHSVLSFEKIAKLVHFLVGMISLLEKLKNYFNFYQQPYLYMFTYSNYRRESVDCTTCK